MQDHFLQLSSFLDSHFELIQTEALEAYPYSSKLYRECALQLASFTKEELLNFQNDLILPSRCSDLFKSLVSQLRLLQSVLQFPYDHIQLDESLLRKLKPKKIHEISVVIDILKKNDITNIVDIGSGQGHLSRVFVDDPNCQALCIDADGELQKRGQTFLKRWFPQHLDRMVFQKKRITKKTNLSIHEKSALVGLHSCGNLSSSLIQKFSDLKKKQTMLVNFGCCYHKIDGEYNLSQASLQNSLKFSSHALELAAKSYKISDLQDLEYRKKVKFYRYGLHLFMQKLGFDFEPIGSARSEDYHLNFSEFVHMKREDLRHFSQKELDDFYSQQSVQTMIHEIYFLDFIREPFGRLIELYIVLDRALFLKESGMKVHIYEAFDRKLSPRNLALLAFMPISAGNRA